MTVEFEEREAVKRVAVCYCDRCGRECPALTDDGYRSGASSFHCATLSVRKTIEGGHSKWGISGSDDAGSSRKGFEESNPTLCLDCLGELIQWLGAAS